MDTLSKRFVSPLTDVHWDKLFSGDIEISDRKIDLKKAIFDYFGVEKTKNFWEANGSFKILNTKDSVTQEILIFHPAEVKYSIPLNALTDVIFYTTAVMALVSGETSSFKNSRLSQMIQQELFSKSSFFGLYVRLDEKLESIVPYQ